MNNDKHFMSYFNNMNSLFEKRFRHNRDRINTACGTNTESFINNKKCLKKPNKLFEEYIKKLLGKNNTNFYQNSLNMHLRSTSSNKAYQTARKYIKKPIYNIRNVHKTPYRNNNNDSNNLQIPISRATLYYGRNSLASSNIDGRNKYKVPSMKYHCKTFSQTKYPIRITIRSARERDAKFHSRIVPPNKKYLSYNIRKSKIEIRPFTTDMKLLKLS